jgi:TRAP-type mannitol/chloroaromatic compound transport system permease large subunit
MELTVLCVSFSVLLLLGVPVAFAIGLSSIATILAAGLPMAVVFQKMVGGMQVFSFLAIPFFVFAGELMGPSVDFEQSGIVMRRDHLLRVIVQQVCHRGQS